MTPSPKPRAKLSRLPASLWLGLAPAYLSQIETGKRDGTLETYRKIAEALNLTLDDLVG